MVPGRNSNIAAHSTDMNVWSQDPLSGTKGQYGAMWISAAIHIALDMPIADRPGHQAPSSAYFAQLHLTLAQPRRPSYIPDTAKIW